MPLRLRFDWEAGSDTSGQAEICRSRPCKTLLLGDVRNIRIYHLQKKASYKKFTTSTALELRQKEMALARVCLACNAGFLNSASLRVEAW